MDLANRIGLLVELGEYIQSGDSKWKAAKVRASQQNAWFTPDFIDLSIQQIVEHFLQSKLLEEWVNGYPVDPFQGPAKKIGLVMAGNIPLVGFHDFLCCFICGHHPVIKLSSRDPWLFPELLQFLKRKNPGISLDLQTAPTLQGMDAYIATGSNNSARYFEYYFGKYPSLIRRNRTSVAILEGNETPEELERLSDDVFQYFGLGCRNVTQVYVPENYDFVPLLNVFRKYQWTSGHHKYKNNYDYRLSLAILNKIQYMTNDCLLLLEDESSFSPISVLHYTYYGKGNTPVLVAENENLQCIVGRNHLPFGQSQHPGLRDYADGSDTMKFLTSL
jgi:hypothetical protein